MAVKGYEEYLLLKRSVEELLSEHDKLRSIITGLETELEAARRELNEKTEEVKELKTRYERARFSGAILGNAEDADIAKRRVNELVREIDKCIALLDR
jgi:hemerythrin-like domain-containing protein